MSGRKYFSPSGAAGYRPEGAAGGWLWGIARRKAALFLRRAGRSAPVLPAVIAADGRLAADPAEAALSRAAIAEAVVALGPKGSPEREAWRLVYVGDRTVAEVAELMGVPAGTVKSRPHRAGGCRGPHCRAARWRREGGTR
jgi:RNA polymerase sigma-70 factor, ECF subfamily